MDTTQTARRVAGARDKPRTRGKKLSAVKKPAAAKKRGRKTPAAAKTTRRATKAASPV